MAHSEETGGAPDAEELTDLANTAQECLSKLATGLAQIGAPPEVAQGIEKMVEIVGKISSGLSKGMKDAPPEAPHTIDSAMEATMAERAAARQAADAAPA